MTPEARELMMNWIADMGPDHDDDCPGDDTCSCSMKPKSDAINACCVFLHNAPARIRELEARLASAEKVVEAVGQITWLATTRKDGGHDFWGNITEMRAAFFAHRTAYPKEKPNAK
jgi:uracil-DNA glycosylase